MSGVSQPTTVQAASSGEGRNLRGRRAAPLELDRATEDQIILSKETGTEKFLEALRIQKVRTESIFAQNGITPGSTSKILAVIPPPKRNEEQPQDEEDQAETVETRESDRPGITDSNKKRVSLDRTDGEEEGEGEHETEESEEREVDSDVVRRRHDRYRPVGRNRNVNEDQRFFERVKMFTSPPTADFLRLYKRQTLERTRQIEEDKKELEKVVEPKAKPKTANRNVMKKNQRRAGASTRNGGRRQERRVTRNSSEEREETPPVLVREEPLAEEATYQVEQPEERPSPALSSSTDDSFDISKLPTHYVFQTPRNVFGGSIFSPDELGQTSQPSTSARPQSPVEYDDPEETSPGEAQREDVYPAGNLSSPLKLVALQPLGGGRRFQAELFPLTQRAGGSTSEESPAQGASNPNIASAKPVDLNAARQHLQNMLTVKSNEAPVVSNTPVEQERRYSSLGLPLFLQPNSDQQHVPARPRILSRNRMRSAGGRARQEINHRVIRPPPGSMLTLRDGRLLIAPCARAPVADVRPPAREFREQVELVEEVVPKVAPAVVPEAVPECPRLRTFPALKRHPLFASTVKRIGFKPPAPEILLPETDAHIDYDNWEYDHWTDKQLIEFAKKWVQNEEAGQILEDVIMKEGVDGFLLDELIKDGKPEGLSHGHWMKFVSAANGVMNFCNARNYDEMMADYNDFVKAGRPVLDYYNVVEEE